MSQTQAEASSVDHSAVNPDDQDVDAVALQAAIAAANAEEAGGPLQTMGAPEVTQPVSAEQPGQDEAVNPAASHMVPKARLDESLHRMREAFSEVERLRRENEELQARGPQAPAINPRETELVNSIDALAKRYDDGEIGYREMKQQERALEDELRTLRAPAPAAPAPAQTQTTGNDESLYLQQQTQQLEQRFPYSQHLPKADLMMLRDKAENALIAEGIYKGDNSEAERLMLREHVGKLTDDFGPLLLKGNDPVLAARDASAQPAASQPPLSANAQARSDKLALAADMPTPIDGLPTGGGGQGAITEESIMAMTPLEREALPKAVRNRLLGI